MRFKRMTFSELVKENKREILANPKALAEIDEKIEKRAQRELDNVYRTK